MAAIIKCVHCGKICTDTDRIYQVRIIECDGQTIYAPACSLECANKEKIKYTDLHRGRVYSMEHQSFQIMKVRDYLGEGGDE